MATISERLRRLVDINEDTVSLRRTAAFTIDVLVAALEAAREGFIPGGSMPLSDEDTVAWIDAALALARGEK